MSDAKDVSSRIPRVLSLGRDRFRAQIRPMGLAAVVGVVAGVGAIFFYVATRVVEHYALGVVCGYYPEPHPGGEPTVSFLHVVDHPLVPCLLILVPTVGGLLSGLIVFHYAPEAEGHGTDSAIDAYHNRNGYIRPRVPIVKIISSALTLGSGGSGGREGPIAQIGAGFGSLLGNLLKLRPSERRVLMAAGMGAGIGAIFRAPLAGTIFAAEVMYASPEFEPEVILPAGIASVVSYCVYGAFSGWEPLFNIPDLKFTNPWELGPYTLLAVFMVLLSMLYTRSFYGMKGVFDRIPIKHHFKPAIGALLTGLVGCGLYFLFKENKLVLAVMAFGYSSLEASMTLDGQPLMGFSVAGTAVLLMAISLGKILTTGLTIGSGGSGGIFGPSMVVGGCGGGALGMAIHSFAPHLVPHPASFVIVGMAGFFAAAAKTPFSTLIIVSEMTGGYSLLLPSLWVCTLSFIFSDKMSIYQSQVEGRSMSLAHRGAFVRQVLAGVRVSQFLESSKAIVSLRASDSLANVMARLREANEVVLPVIDASNRLLGVVNLEEVHLASQSPELTSLVLAVDLMRSDVHPLLPEFTLDRAQELFVENDLPRLPIVDSLDSRKLVGMIGRFEVASAYLQRLHGPAEPSTAARN